MSRTLEGKLVLITGAKGGLGTTVTNAMLDAGASVFGVSRSIQKSDFAHPNFTAMPVDLSTSEAARRLAEDVTRIAGRIDAVVHLMGGFAGGRPVEDTDDATFDRMFDLNLKPAIYILRAVLPGMKAKRAGRIVAIGSRAAVQPQAQLSAYNASKAALVSLIQTVALENKAHGITANVILPGTMDTPANRAENPAADHTAWVQPEQPAALVVHLASDAASQITGAAIPIYGGEL